CRGLPLNEVETLLRSPLHEERSLALLILVDALARSDVATQKLIYDLYLANTRYVNNWDLVDLSARDIVGAFLFERSRRPLYRLAPSVSIWVRRITIFAIDIFIRQHHFAVTVKIAGMLLVALEDLLHNPHGWRL